MCTDRYSYAWWTRSGVQRLRRFSLRAGWCVPVLAEDSWVVATRSHLRQLRAPLITAEPKLQKKMKLIVSKRYTVIYDIKPERLGTIFIGHVKLLHIYCSGVRYLYDCQHYVVWVHVENVAFCLYLKDIPAKAEKNWLSVPQEKDWLKRWRRKL